MEKQQITHIGGHPLIDFINTKMTPNGKLVDLLTDNEAVIYWLTDIGLFTEAEVHFDWAEEATLLSHVHTFRQKMRSMLDDIVQKQPIASETVTTINEALAHWRGQVQLGQNGQDFSRQIGFAIEDSMQLVAVIADTAVDFLTSTNLSYVKRCGNGECIRYFLDTSKNHSRRWCSMEGCGNRMKARAHYARQK